jgi:TolA-binding protein
MIDPSVVMSKTRRLEILREYVAARSDATSAPDMRYEDHIIKAMKLVVEEFASYANAEIKRIESGHETDIATLEQEARQMRARMERLECENTQLAGLVEAQRDGLLAALEGAANYIDRLSGDSSGYRIAIASVRGAGCGMKGGTSC